MNRRGEKRQAEEAADDPRARDTDNLETSSADAMSTNAREGRDRHSRLDVSLVALPAPVDCINSTTGKEVRDRPVCLDNSPASLPEPGVI